MKMGYEGLIFFPIDWDWLRGCVNLCLEEIRPEGVLLLQEWRKKLCSFSPHVRRPGGAFLDQVGIWNLYPSQKIYIKCWNRKILALGIPPPSLNAASNITHSASASQDSSRKLTIFNAHCTVHCAVEDFNVSLRITTQSRYDTVPYSAHDITCRSRIMELRLGLKCTKK